MQYLSQEMGRHDIGDNRLLVSGVSCSSCSNLLFTSSKVCTSRPHSQAKHPASLAPKMSFLYIVQHNISCPGLLTQKSPESVLLMPKPSIESIPTMRHNSLEQHAWDRPRRDVAGTGVAAAEEGNTVQKYVIPPIISNMNSRIRLNVQLLTCILKQNWVGLLYAYLCTDDNGIKQ